MHRRHNLEPHERTHPEGLAKIESHVKTFDLIFSAFVTCAKLLAAKGGQIINEWPTGCEYWRKPKVHKTFSKLGFDYTAHIHGCSLGLKSVVYPDQYIKKPWKLKATFAALAEVFQHALCPGVSDEHGHTPCAGADT